MPPITASERVSPSGMIFAIAAYVLWGFLPLYFAFLAPAGAVEIVAWRIVLSVAFCAVLLTIARSGWTQLWSILRDLRVVGILTLAAVLILINWLIFVGASLAGHVLEASLGYFINPLVTVVLGIVVLRERLRPAQWVAVGVSVIAVLVLSFGYGSVPWIALGLAFSFGLYGLVKKRVGGRVDAISGLTVETLVLTPAAIITLIVIAVTTGLTIGTVSTLHTVLLLSAGVATATPLILFASAARRLPLVYLGLVQYVAPVLQFIMGVTLLGEEMPLERWIGFGIVWVALVILSTDAVIAGSRARGVRKRESAESGVKPPLGNGM